MKDHAMRHPLSYQFHCIVRAREPNGDSYAIGTWIVEQGQGRIDTDAGPIACASIREATRALYARLDKNHALKHVPRWTLQWQYSLTPVIVDIPGFIFSTIQYIPTPTPWMRWPSLRSVAAELAQWLCHTQETHTSMHNPRSITRTSYGAVYNNPKVYHRRLGQNGIMANIHPTQVSGRRSIMIPEPQRPGIPIELAVKQHHVLIPTPLPSPYAITTSIRSPMDRQGNIYLVNQDTCAIMANLPEDISELKNWLNTHIPTPPAAWFSSNHARIEWMRYVEPQLHHVITHTMTSIRALDHDIQRWIQTQRTQHSDSTNGSEADILHL